MARQDRRDNRGPKEIQGPWDLRVHLAKEGLQVFPERMVTTERTEGRALKVPLVQQVPEGRQECRDCLAPKVTGVFLAWTGLKVNKDPREKRAPWGRLEKWGHRDQLDQVDPEAREDGTDKQVLRAFAALTACQDHPVLRVLLVDPVHQDSQALPVQRAIQEPLVQKEAWDSKG